MRLQLHAKRYADDPAERDQLFNSTPADLDIGDREVIIIAKGNRVTIRLDQDEPIFLVLSEVDHTAIALVCGSEDG